MSKKISFEDAMKRNIRKDLDEYIIHDETYKGITKKIDITHKNCNNRYGIEFRNFLKGNECKFCANKTRGLKNIKPLSDKEIKILNDLDLSVIDYNGITKPMTVKHSKCGYKFTRTFKKIKSEGCPKCNLKKVDKINKNISKYQAKIDHLECDIVPEYFRTTRYSKFKCRKCGSYINNSYYNILNRNEFICDCSEPTSFKDIVYYKNKLNEMNISDKYTLIESSYINSVNKMDILCHTCGEVFNKTPSDFFSNLQFCPKCVKDNRKYTISEINNKLKKLRFEIVGDYINSHHKTKFRCLECNTIKEDSLNNILNNGSLCTCQYKFKSYGESIIEDFLIKNNISYIKEKSFNDLKVKKKLRYDFFIKDLNTLIEFDGVQHFLPIDFFGGIDYLKRTKFYDSLKDKYAKENNIKLIRIPYYNIDNINDILKNTLLMESRMR